MTIDEKIRWLETDMEFLTTQLELYQPKVDEYNFRMGIARSELDRLYDIKNNVVKE